MNRFSITRKLQTLALNHPAILDMYVKVIRKKPNLPRGYRKITKK